MMKILLRASMLALSLAAAIVSAGESSAQAPARKGTEPTALDRWNEIKRQAERAVAAIPNPFAPRRVKRGAKPEIIIKGSSIYFEGMPLEFGRPLKAWKNIIKRKPHCDKTGNDWCVWQELGLEVMTSNEDHTRVSGMVIKLNVYPDPYEDIRVPYPDGRPDDTPKADWNARHPFTGYLEIDGFGIDKETTFWDLRSAIGVSRNLECGLLDCEFPRGTFGQHGEIALKLNGRKDSAAIEEIRIWD